MMVSPLPLSVIIVIFCLLPSVCFSAIHKPPSRKPHHLRPSLQNNQRGESASTLLPSHPLTPIHFGVVLAIASRKIDPDFLLLSRRSIPSVVSQTFSNWTLFLVGDHLSSSEEKKVRKILADLPLPPEKYVFYNLKEEETKEAIYARLGKNEGDPWFNSGTAPFNAATDRAVHHPLVTHIKAWSDDDSMRPNHLQRLREAYSVSDTIAYAFTCGYSTGDVVYPRRDIDHNGPPNSFIHHMPQVSHTVAVSVSWSVKWLGFIRMRFDFEQMDLREKWGELPRGKVVNIKRTALANDAFQYVELKQYIDSSQCVLDTTPSVDYLDHEHRKSLLKDLYGVNNG